MRDFAAELDGVRCWDAALQRTYAQRGEPLADAVLQSREELIALCQFIAGQNIRSYLEIGAWTGRLASTLHRLFDFALLAVCDDGYARRFGLELQLPDAALRFAGRSDSPDFAAWRAALGPIDLVFIDADHSERGVRADFARERQQPHRFLAFHDITGANPHTAGVGRFWRGLDEGWCLELCRPHREIGLERSDMGIGLWSAVPVESPGWVPARAR